MRWWRRGRDRDAEIDRELRDHLDLEAEEQRGNGLNANDARYAAQRAFGNTALVKEDTRAMWVWTSIEQFTQDLRYAVRQLRKSPAFAIASILTLALGIGANTAVFSVVNAVVLRPLPFPEADRLVAVASCDTRGGPHPTNLSYPTFFDFRRDNRVFDHIVSFRNTGLTLTGYGQALSLRGQIVSWDLFQMLGVQPVLGRAFRQEEEAAGQRVAIISHGLWQSRFGGDRSIVGKTVTLDALPYIVVGVAPAGFQIPGRVKDDVWVTLAVDATSYTVTPVTEQRGSRMLDALARLKPGVTLEQAQTRMDAVATAISRQYPDSNKNIASTYVRPALDVITDNSRKPLLFLLSAVGVVLLIACANIANLLLARTAEREHEFALRASLGADSTRIIRQLVTESLAMSLAGCAAGALTAMAILKLVVPLAGESMPRIAEASLDATVLAFAIGLAVLTSVLFSLAPLLHVMRTRLTSAFGANSRTVAGGPERLRSALCVGQIALGLILVTGASLLTASFANLVRRDLGFPKERLLTFGVDLPGAEYPKERRIDFHGRLIESLQNMPGAEAAAMSMPLPLVGAEMQVSFNIQERPSQPGERPSSNMAIVTPTFFKTIRLPLLQGREFTDRDNENAPPVLIVNQAFASKFFPGENAVGKLMEPGATSGPGGTKMREIVGVVANARQSPLAQDPDPIYYFPYKQMPWCCGALIVRTAVDSLSMESAVRSVVTSMDKQIPVSNIETLDGVLDKAMTPPRFLLSLVVSFAGMALLLTLIGLYGVLAYSVARRTREMGVRMALGATRGSVLGMVLKKAMLLVAIGVSIGLAGSLAGAEVLRKVLFGIGPRDPLLIGGACALVVVTAALAAYLPARRASRVDPMTALRCE